MAYQVDPPWRRSTHSRDTQDGNSSPHSSGGEFGGYGVPYPDVDRGDDKYASKMRANIARAQWGDYKKRFQPYEGRLVDMADEGPGEMIGTATRQAGEQFGVGLGVAQRQRDRYGSDSPGDQVQRSNQLDRGLATVGAANRARDAWEQQRMGLMSGDYGNRKNWDRIASE